MRLKKRKFKYGTRYTHQDGYIFLSGVNKKEHILIAEKALGKKLPKHAVVHHANENRSDNRNSNLVICPDNSYHRLLHRRLDAYKACGNPSWIKCSYCKKYDDPKNMYVRTYKRLGDYGIRKATTSRHYACTKKYMKKYFQEKIKLQRKKP